VGKSEAASPYPMRGVLAGVEQKATRSVGTRERTRAEVDVANRIIVAAISGTLGLTILAGPAWAKDPWKHYYKEQEKQAKEYHKLQRKQAKEWDKYERKQARYWSR